MSLETKGMQNERACMWTECHQAIPEKTSHKKGPNPKPKCNPNSDPNHNLCFVGLIGNRNCCERTRSRQPNLISRHQKFHGDFLLPCYTAAFPTWSSALYTIPCTVQAIHISPQRSQIISQSFDLTVPPFSWEATWLWCLLWLAENCRQDRLVGPIYFPIGNHVNTAIQPRAVWSTGLFCGGSIIMEQSTGHNKRSRHTNNI